MYEFCMVHVYIETRQYEVRYLSWDMRLHFSAGKIWVESRYVCTAWRNRNCRQAARQCSPLFCDVVWISCLEVFKMWIYMYMTELEYVVARYMLVGK